ncbi:restriction endonuclease subunit S [Anoxybacillus flavithermus]|uniref:restriction endonuclease subunit S n=1 Tax=Anoxybacillus flavithermus TaxID=33934 RepID=UPI001867E6D4|nr:restriction endonuclease subunit S [Anoxybacillus flavithermus]MBE2929894.1 restriction endonuclease subunit S [Anoxybacillus flavithermus]MBE2932776.1 restriction endonuclease subunit S [Anoxybacillus flavithermus]MBE2956836.1 restriction endonuclease subunit S [Anoxybacillus flavithermus]
MGEWQKVKLGDVCEISSGKASKYTKDQSGMFKVYGSNGVIGSYNEANFYRGYLVGRVGAVGSIQKITEPVWASDNTLTLVINEDLIDFDFMEHLLSTMTLANYATKTAQPLLTQTTLKKIEVELPPLSEQRKIAAILSSVDEAIEKTEAIIEQTEKVKKGLMQQLLTKGIGHTKFKKTEIGEIPEQWEIRKLNQVSTRITEKNKGKTDRVLTISGLHGLVSQTEYFNKSVASKNIDGYYYLRKGDFAYNKSYSDGYPLGAIKMLERYPDGVVSTLYICFRINENMCKDYFRYYFESNLWNSEVSAIAPEGGRSHGLLNVGVNDFFNIFIPIPPIEEQYKISSIIRSVENKEKLELEKLEKLKTIKMGLMQVLLTGKVRVKVEDEVMSQ